MIFLIFNLFNFIGYDSYHVENFLWFPEKLTNLAQDRGKYRETGKALRNALKFIENRERPW